MPEPGQEAGREMRSVFEVTRQALVLLGRKRDILGSLAVPAHAPTVLMGCGVDAEQCARP